MENATKALQMAASVLFAMMIIGLITFSFAKVEEAQAKRQDEIKTQQMLDFNKQYGFYEVGENYYGAELISCINLMEDYNNRVAYELADTGYQKVALKIKVINEYDANFCKYLNKKYTTNLFDDNTKSDLADFKKAYNKLQEELSKAANKKVSSSNSKGKVQTNTVSYWASLRDNVLIEYFDETDLAKLKAEIEKYEDLLTEQTDFSRTRFKCVDIEYDSNNNRIILMKFRQLLDSEI